MFDALIIFGAKYLIVVPVSALVAYFFYTSHKKELLVVTILALPLAYVLARLAGLLYYDPLPFVVDGIPPLIEHIADNGFPSDHTLIAGVLATVAILRHRALGVCLWIVTALIGMARMLAGVHHAVDVLAAALIAALTVLLAEFLFRRVSSLLQGHAS